MATSRLFYAEYLGECPVCRSLIEPGHLLAMQDDKAVHVEHHDDAGVRARGQAMPSEPVRRRKKWRGRRTGA